RGRREASRSMARAYPGSFTCKNTIVPAGVERGLGSKVPLGRVPDAVQRLLAIYRRAGTCEHEVRDGSRISSAPHRAAERPGHAKRYATARITFAIFSIISPIWSSLTIRGGVSASVSPAMRSI